MRMGRIMRLREAAQDGIDVDAGGKPSTGTPKDKRLKENGSGATKSGNGVVNTPAAPKATPAKVTHGL
jgi:hypothetical protein